MKGRRWSPQLLALAAMLVLPGCISAQRRINGNRPIVTAGFGP